VSPQSQTTPEPNRTEGGNQSAGRPMIGTQSYNRRLFGKGLRGWFHGGRFRWLAAQYGNRVATPANVVELGCFDGKAIHCFVPPPARYLGMDANWEGGLDLARELWAASPFAEFRAVPVTHAASLDEQFDVGVCMETMEHLPDDILDAYIQLFAAHVTKVMFVTVPNEIGPVCALKQIAKKLFFGGSIFSWGDIGNACIGRTERIVRDEHRGFDYRRLVQRLGRNFRVVKVQGIPFPFLPAWLNFTVGIVLLPRADGPGRETADTGSGAHGT
jgi:hypothetical protein